MRAVVLLVCAVLLALPACTDQRGTGAAAPLALSAGGQSMACPGGVDPALMRSLAAELTRVLASRAKAAAAQSSPLLTPQRSNDGADAVLSWEYNLRGDYNQDGVVGIQDLAPVGIHFGARDTDGDWAAASRADGSGDGQISVQDVAPIGLGWLGRLTEYIVEAADTAAGPWTEVGSALRTAGTAPAGGGLLQFSLRITGGAAYGYFRVYGDDAGASTAGDKWELWHGGTKLRGANLWQTKVETRIYDTTLGPGPYGPPVTQADLNALAAMGANYVNISHPGLYSVSAPYGLDADAQANLDSLLALAEAADLFAVITFRTGPGRSEFTFNREEVGDWFEPGDLIETVWTTPAQQAAWAAMWRYTAARYRNNPAVAAYDIMCEPNSPEVVLGLWDEVDEYYPAYAGAVHDWNVIYPPVVSAIREVDTQTPVIVAATGWSNAVWLPSLAPSAAGRIVYAVHQYAPSEYTHQTDAALPAAYPGQVDLDGDGTPDQFDQAALSAIFDPVRQYQALQGAPVCSNEYGVMRFEPGAAQFISDEVELFDSLGMNNAIWEWTPAFLSTSTEIDWDEFNFRHGPDRDHHSDVASSELMTVLSTYWGRNTLRPSNFHEEPPVNTRAQQLKAARHFMYQLQGLEEPGGYGALTASHYDVLVVEPSQTVQGNEDFDMAGMVAALKASADSQGGNKLVLAYVDIGQAEDYRTYWQPDWVPPTATQRGVPDFMLTIDPDGWSGDYPVAYWDTRWQALLVDDTDSVLRMVLAAGFDGIYMDWVGGYTEPAVVQAAQEEGKDPAAEMLAFISHIREAARQSDPQFLVVQQNAPELISDAPGILDVIDGLGMEDIWYLGDSSAPWGDPAGGDIPQESSGDYSTPALIAWAQQYQAAGLPVLTIDYCLVPAHAAQVYTDSQALGFIPLVSQISLSQLTGTPPPWY